MKRGFTFLVVGLIIAILAAVALPQYTKAVTKARFAEALINLKAIGQADKVCRLAMGKTICDIENLDINIPGNYENFQYSARNSPAGCLNCKGEEKIIASALYSEEDVCVCLSDSGEFTIEQSGEFVCRPKKHLWIMQSY